MIREQRATRKLRRGTQSVCQSPARTRAERFVDRAAMMIACELMAMSSGEALDAITCKRGRGRPKRRPSQARKLAIYLTATVINIPIGRLARSARTDWRDISKWLHEIEDRRENPDYDAFVSRLEGQLSERVLTR